jgi:hypothetical protein
MATCDVLRCRNDAEAGARLTPEDAIPMYARSQMLLRLGYPATPGTVSGRRPVDEVLRTF